MKILVWTLWLAGAVFAHAEDAVWLTSLPQAAQIAERESKSILIDFTGSDWCEWCMKLDADTLSKDEFIQYARLHLVLVRLDFPRRTPQPANLASANRELSKKYSVDGFPTLVNVKPDGTVLWRSVGYLPGGPAALIADLNKANPSAAAGPDFTKASFPAQPPRQPGDEPKLQAILYSRHPTVTLDGKVAEEGDTVNGMRVIKIARDHVTVAWLGANKDLFVK